MARFHLPSVTGAVLGAALLFGCGDDTPDSKSDAAAAAYESFFVELDRGNREDALEGIAPTGALGDTFRGGAYFTYADAIEARLDRHDGLDAVVIDDAGEVDEDTVRVEGRLRFGDGTEIERRITFVREEDDWVGQL